MNIQTVGIEGAYRIVKSKNDGPRTIVAKLSSYKLKQLIFSNASNLKGIEYFMNENYSKDTAAINASSLKGTDNFINEDYSRVTAVIRKENGWKLNNCESRVNM